MDELHGEKRGLYTLGSCLRCERPLSGRGLEARKRFTVAVRPPRGLYSTPIESRSSWCHVAFSTKAKRSQLSPPRVPFITISRMQSVPRELTRTDISCRPSPGRGYWSRMTFSMTRNAANSLVGFFYIVAFSWNLFLSFFLFSFCMCVYMRIFNSKRK